MQQNIDKVVFSSMVSKYPSIHGIRSFLNVPVEISHWTTS